MLAQLSTVKAWLGIPDADTTNDALLTEAIKAVSARFDRETRRTLARTENFSQEFDADSCEIIAACYPIETVTRFEFKTSEAAGWQELVPLPEYVIRARCIISLAAPLSSFCTLHSSLCRITYAGGYVLPGDNPQPGASNFQLPSDLEHGAVEQTAYWFQNRDRLGVIREWPKGGIYRQFVDLDLLPSVRAVLAHYERWTG